MQLKIGNVQLDNNVLFAPIAGFSEVGFRHMCSKYGAGLTYTELVSAKGLCYGNKGTEELLAREDFSTPCAVVENLFDGTTHVYIHDFKICKSFVLRGFVHKFGIAAEKLNGARR